MNIDERTARQLAALFKPLNSVSATVLPAASSLSTKLTSIIPSKGKSSSVKIEPATARMFASAAIDAWLRGLHSFLISASLNSASPIWASVAGYYSSYYCVRALAHALGYFHLYRRKYLVTVEHTAGSHICSFSPKSVSDHEHRVYWKLVKQSPLFASDAFFTENSTGPDESDVGHRNHANYADHLYPYPPFMSLKDAVIKVRIQKISEIEISTPPIPNRKRYPDIESVQVVAYHRLVRFRQFLDQALGDTNRFWNVHRKPTWVRDMMDFQVTKPGGDLSIPGST